MILTIGFLTGLHRRSTSALHCRWQNPVSCWPLYRIRKAAFFRRWRRQVVAEERWREIVSSCYSYGPQQRKLRGRDGPEMAWRDLGASVLDLSCRVPADTDGDAPHCSLAKVDHGYLWGRQRHPWGNHSYRGTVECASQSSLSVPPPPASPLLTHHFSVFRPVPRIPTVFSSLFCI